MRAGILIVAVIALIAAMAFTLKTLTKGPLAFAGGRTVALADYHAADPTGVPQNLANADQVKRGEYLARAADCLVCHTALGGADYAGGLAIPLPFGTRPTKTPALAIIATRIFSMPCAAAGGAMAPVFIRRCRTRPIPT